MVAVRIPGKLLSFLDQQGCPVRGPGASIFPSLNLVEIQLRRVEIQEIAHPPGTPGCVTFSPDAPAPCREASSPV